MDWVIQVRIKTLFWCTMRSFIIGLRFLKRRPIIHYRIGNDEDAHHHWSYYCLGLMLYFAAVSILYWLSILFEWNQITEPKSKHNHYCRLSGLNNFVVWLCRDICYIVNTTCKKFFLCQHLLISILFTSNILSHKLVIFV